MATEYKINPQVTEIELGVSDLRTYKVYPLSVGDQLELTNHIADSISTFLSATNILSSITDPDLEMTENQIGALVVFLSDTLKDNLEKVLRLVIGTNSFLLDESETNNLMRCITNAQVIEIIDLVIEMNFNGNLKNAKSLFKKIKGLFAGEKMMESIKSSPQSVNDMDTDSTTSLNPSEEAD